jgi:RHS repeat-associated protein
MQMPGRSFNAGNYRYGFNGKENDNEVQGEGNQQDYGMRIYDTRVGRFLSVDPIASDYSELTPYQFGSNRPVDGIDQDGLEWELGTIKHNLETKIRLNDYLSIKNMQREFVGPATAKPYLPVEVRVHRFFTTPSLRRDILSIGTNGTSELFFGLANDSKIVGSPFLNGGRNARDLGGNSATPKERLYSFLNLATTIGGPLLGAEIKTGKAISEGISLKNTTPQIGEKFGALSYQLLDGRINLSSRSVTNGTFDFIISNQGELIVGNGHYNLSNGAESVKAAGQLRLYKGQVMEINNSSGHYKPTPEEMLLWKR